MRKKKSCTYVYTTQNENFTNREKLNVATFVISLHITCAVTPLGRTITKADLVGMHATNEPSTLMMEEVAKQGKFMWM
jgi:hypothetical protein